MKTSDLCDYINCLISGETLAGFISDEIEVYKSLFQKKGTSIPLNFTEDKNIILNKSSVCKLLNDTHDGHLSNIHLAYICDCLTLGENVTFENEVIEEIIIQIADPEINGGFKSPDEISELIDKLG